MRFLQNDPPLERRSQHHYAYADHLPTRHRDPQGSAPDELDEDTILYLYWLAENAPSDQVRDRAQSALRNETKRLAGQSPSSGYLKKRGDQLATAMRDSGKKLGGLYYSGIRSFGANVFTDEEAFKAAAQQYITYATVKEDMRLLLDKLRQVKRIGGG